MLFFIHVYLFSADRSSDCISSNDPSCVTRCLRRDNMQGQCVCPPGMALHDDNETCIGNCLISLFMISEPAENYR